MRRLVPLVAASFVLVAVAFTVGRVSAQSNPIPGSPSDPLVTKSYVTSAIQAALSGQSSTPTGVAFTLVTLNAGATLTASANAEMIVRRGSASAVVAAPGGIVDLTAGANLTTGAFLTANHLLLVPKTDGCGFTAKTSMIVLVSGSYSVSSS